MIRINSIYDIIIIIIKIVHEVHNKKNCQHDMTIKKLNNYTKNTIREKYTD